MSEGTSSVSSSFADDASGSCLLDPLGRGHDESVVASLVFNRLEFHTVKIGIVKTLLDAEEVYDIARSHPVLDDEARVVSIAVFGNVG